MDPLYLRKLRIDRQIQQQMRNLNSAEKNSATNSANASGVQNNEPVKSGENMNNQANQLVKDIRDEVLTPRRQRKYNYIASMERSDYVKKMMNLPRTLPELLIQLQRPNYNNAHNVMNNQMPQPDVLKGQVNNNDEHFNQEENGSKNNQNRDEKPNSNLVFDDGFETVLRDEVKKQDVIRNNNQQQQTTNNIKQPLGEIGNNGNKADNANVVKNPNMPIDEEFSQSQLPQRPNNNLRPNNPMDNRPNMPNQPLPPNNNGMRPNPPLQPDRPMPPHNPNQPSQPNMPNQPLPPNNNGMRPNLPLQPDRPMPPHDNIRPPHFDGVRPNPPLQPEGPMPPHDNIRPPHFDGMRPNPPFPPNNNVIPPNTQYIIGNVEMLAPRHLHNTHHHEHIIDKPPVENPSSEIGAVKDSTLDDAQAILYQQLSMNDIANPTLTQMRQRLSDDAFELLFTGMLNLNDLSNTIKHNGKDARSKLILALANASKQGVDNTQISGSLKMVSESMAMEENNPASILKNIILLYLPWYPLQDGVGFNLAIETMPNMSDFSSLLKVFIQTRHYGNVNGSLILMNANNVDMQIQCDDKFPKDDLLERMKEVTQNHTMQSNITVEQRVQMENEVENQQAKVNLSSTYDLNPFLLLMAHSFIKNTIIIDGSANA